LFRTIDALKVFDLIWVITAGGPGFGSETLYVYAYNQAFKYLDLGYGSAVIVGFTLIVAGARAVWVPAPRRAWAGRRDPATGVSPGPGARRAARSPGGCGARPPASSSGAP